VPGLLLEESVVSPQFLGVTYREPASTTVATLAALPLYGALLIPLSRFIRQAQDSAEARRYAAG
jgi:hypothetical protein